jgi:hypothetical protein
MSNLGVRAHGLRERIRCIAACSAQAQPACPAVCCAMQAVDSTVVKALGGARCRSTP